VIELVKKRTSNFGRKARIFGDGTPTVDGTSEIQRQFKRGDQRRWFVHCPECDEAQYFKWSQMKWVEDNPETAQYACEHCGALNTERLWKSRGYEKAHWRPTAKGETEVASWHLPALLAPLGWRPWVKCVAEWIAAQGDEEALKVFYNNTLAECWKDTVHAEVSAEALQARAENYPLMQLPHGALMAVAGVDVQDNRLAVGITGFGRGEESWRIFYGEIYGSPSSLDVWAKLSELLNAPIRHASGHFLRGVDAAAIDTGGHHTAEVYAFTRDAKLKAKHWFAVKGASQYDAIKLGKPKQVEFNYKGRPIAGGAELRFIGTQSIKTFIFGRIHEIKQPGPGFWHFSLGLTLDYYQQLITEKRVWKKDNKTGRKVLMWIKGSGLRNEAWDCEVYSYVAYLYSTSGRHVETIFREREKLFGETQIDLFASRDDQPKTDLAAIAADLNSEELTDQAETAMHPQPPIDESKVLPSIFKRRSGRRVRSRGVGS
jgi:phage terminase large subunit GpA-like protein